ncbi:MAG: DegV family EDD domain-containing protein [Chloroflexi bacterium]|nr:DegV family EDD domain-containing protein [Chloroflexota bacterium]
MGKIGILTDSTAQFPTPVFAGRKLVNVIPLHIQTENHEYAKADELKAADFSATLNNKNFPKVFAPSVDEFHTMLSALGKRYSEIILILHSSKLSPTYANSMKAAEIIQGQIPLQIVDSQTTAIGLGLLVQAAAAAVEEGMPLAEIDRHIRGMIPRIYSVFCIEGLTYLEKSGYLGTSQALIGEFLNVLPIYIFDNGQLVPTQKARNYRHLIDILHEFLTEFDDLKHIALLQGVPPFETETRTLRDRISEDFPDTSLSEHTISAALASILGPRSLGMFVLQED